MSNRFTLRPVTTSLDLTASTAAASAPNTADVSSKDVMSVGIWFRAIPSTALLTRLVYKYDDASNGWQFVLRSGAGIEDMTWLVRRGGVNYRWALLRTAHLTENRWYHLLCTNDVAGPTATAYLNGQPIPAASTGGPPPFPNASPLLWLSVSGGSGINHSKSLVSKMAIYDRIVTAQEARERYQYDIRPAGCVAEWPFDEGLGVTARDVINANDFTLVGANWSAGSPPRRRWF